MAEAPAESVDPVTEQAHEWRLRLARSGLTDAEWRTFEIWLAADIRHEDAYDRAVTLDQALGTLAAEHYDARLLQLSRSEGLSWFFASARNAFGKAGFHVALGAATAVMVGVLVAVPILRTNSAPGQTAPATQRYASDVGEIATLTLDDGSVASLGAASEIEITMLPDRRKLRLIDGAVLVEVAKDEARPFSVRAGNLTATALGTVFDVRKNAGVVRVAVSEGAVRVSYPLMIDGAPASLTTHRDIEAGQQVAATREGLQQARSIQKDLVGAWRALRLDYLDASLRELVADANRYSPLAIEIEDPDSRLSDATVTATFDGGNIERMLATLPDIMPVDVDRSASERIVIRPTP